MVASDVKSNSLPDDFAEKVVKEALAKAKELQDEGKRSEVVEQCDIALGALAKLDDTPHHLRWKSEALQMKGQSIHFPRGTEEAISYYEQVLEIKKNSGNKRDYANYLNFMGSVYKGEKAVSAYRQALALFEELGDRPGQAESHIWRGVQALVDGGCDVALNHFQHSAEHYAQSDTNRDWKAVCHAAIQVLQEIADAPGEKLSLRRGAVCETLQCRSDRIIYAGQPGFGVSTNLHASEEVMGIDLFYAIAQMKPILDLTWRVGGTWEQDVFSYTFNPLKARKIFESDSEMVRTPAGEFARCWKFRVDTTQQPIEEMDEQTKRQYELNKINCGSREFWFAPGIGLVKYRADQESGLKGTVELASYSVQNETSDYFPLAVGNWWEYRPAALHKNYVYKDRFEIIDGGNEQFFISHCQYAYWNGSEEERKVFLDS